MGSGERIVEQVSFLKGEMLELLEELVLIQSGTMNKTGLDRMARTVFRALSGILPQVEIISMQECGNMVLAWNNEARTCKPILLVGHMDTVFPQDTDFNFFRQDREKIYGPGVMDMKGGLVVGFFALKALSRLGLLEDIPITFICNSEEEIGSPFSRVLIEEQARKSRAAFVLEGGGVDGQVAVGRKGKIGLDLKVTGRAGHAGVAGLDKPSAVLEAAHKTIALEALNHPPDVLVNVGLVQGGIGPNTIAREAVLGVDARFADQKNHDAILEEIRKIAGQTRVPGTRTEMRVISSRPAMPTSRNMERLYQLVEGAAQKVGVPIAREIRGGVSDANFIAATGTPVLDGLGPCGDLDHSDQEFIIKKTLPQRAALVAQSILEVMSEQV
ncbi:M20 family metallopeptidase [Desulfonatronovibrio hydrogenovorans]|uniref:M20 family metallopeptidase n=1 Tax=Desulfonatronovibrio hydrogenovorans TaxID=53245 RepID=UPI00049021F1|nr:M20 family metallopeptidase [Desulfonatronovibrio hydrogenovorans]